MIEVFDYGVDYNCAATKPVVALRPVKSPIQLRDYQEAAYEAIIADLHTVDSALCVMATGLGKTILFSKIIESWDGRVLVVVNREELLQNAYSEIESITGEILGIERGPERHLGERIVVGTVQTMSLKLERYGRNYFSLIIADEAHNCASKAYRDMFEYFSSAKRVGFTATDARADGKTLPFAKCSYRMGIREGIEASYLVPIRGKRVVIESIDLTRVRRTGKNESGDFDDSALDEEMVKGSAAIADVILNDYNFDKGILFFPGCASAKLTSEFLNKRAPGISVYIDGKITGLERRALVNLLRSGEASWLCNVGIATEGFNWPDAAVVGMCAPTLSRTAYVQRAGRGTRPLQGLLNGLFSVSSRQDAILQSAKPYMTIVDFVGVSANLNLIGHESFTGLNELEEIGKTKRNATAGIEVVEDESDNPPETLPGIARPRFDNFGRIASGIQSRTLHGVESFDPIEDLTEGSEGIKFPKAKAEKTGLISEKQINLLAKHGLNVSGSCSSGVAGKLVGYLAQNKFRLGAGQKMILRKLYDTLKG